MTTAYDDPTSGGRKDNLDDLDAMLLEEEGFASIFEELDTNMDVPDLPRKTPAQARISKTSGPIGEQLGLDEEVEVKKKRRVVVKMDEKRLMSQNGVPKLRQIAKTKLRLKGKGHEFSDAERVISMYQLWLDELYPKANFTDGLALLEKLGHVKMIQEYRKGWLQEGAKRSQEQREAIDLDIAETLPLRTNTKVSNIHKESTEPLAESRAAAASQATIWDDDDDLYSLTPPKKQTAGAVNEPPRAHDDMPEEDELDALLAAESTKQPIKTVHRDEIEDEMDFWDM